MSEAIILALFFTFVFAAIMHMHDMFGAKLKTYGQVRSCTWSYIHGGCEALPPACALAEAKTEMSPVGLEAWSKTQSDKWKNKVAGTFSFLHKMLDELNILGKQIRVTKKSEPIPRTPMLGGGSGQVRGSYAMFCNEPRRENFTMVEEAFCRIVGSGFPGC
jgi:hypothetical protein